MKKQKFRKAITKNDTWIKKGVIGKATYPANSLGNVMFYPYKGHPYRICLNEGDIEWK